MRLTKQDVLNAVYGGVFYGGGGGGYFDVGMLLGNSALELGPVELVRPESLPEDTPVACVGFVGAPAAKGYLPNVQDTLRSVDLFLEHCACPPRAFMTNENGAMATVNGWLQAAYTNTVVVDAPANGRAHPTGVMGAMGLNRLPDYVSEQAVYASPEKNEFFLGTIDDTSARVRAFASQCGGLLPVVRNVISAGFVRKNAAVGAIDSAMKVGAVNVASLKKAPLTAAESIAGAAGGRVVDRGTVVAKEISTADGFDVGKVTVRCGAVDYTSVFWNEHLDLVAKGTALARFPDLTVLFDFDKMRCMTTAEIQPGMQVALIVVPAQRLTLGRGMFLNENMIGVEKLLAR